MELLEINENLSETPNETKTKITVTRVLAELKTIQNRISKNILNCEIIKVRRKEDKWDVQEFNRLAQSNYQSIVDLIKRRDYLKSRIIKSNATTIVWIGHEELTVAEVIDRKKFIQFKKDLLSNLRDQRHSAQLLYDSRTDELRKKLDHLLEVNFGKDGKSIPENIAAITKSFYDTNKVELIDPVNISTKIRDLEDETTEFDKEADLVLSESNAQTFIEL